MMDRRAQLAHVRSTAELMGVTLDEHAALVADAARDVEVASKKCDITYTAGLSGGDDPRRRLTLGTNFSVACRRYPRGGAPVPEVRLGIFIGARLAVVRPARRTRRSNASPGRKPAQSPSNSVAS